MSDNTIYTILPIGEDLPKDFKDKVADVKKRKPKKIRDFVKGIWVAGSGKVRDWTVSKDNPSHAPYIQNDPESKKIFAEHVYTYGVDNNAFITQIDLGDKEATFDNLRLALESFFDGMVESAIVRKAIAHINDKENRSQRQNMRASEIKSGSVEKRATELMTKLMADGLPIAEVAQRVAEYVESHSSLNVA